jgi:hypothetical protein
MRRAGRASNIVGVQSAIGGSFGVAAKFCGVALGVGALMSDA